LEEEESAPRREYQDRDEYAPPRRSHRGDDRSGPREGGRGGRDRDDRRGGRGRGRDSRERRGGRPGTGRPKPLIQDIFKRGQEVLVQVIKEGIGTKGPTLSTYISIPGRYLVVMPHLNRVGVSRKIEDEEQRRRLREIFTELKPPRGLGFIMRTAAIDKNKRELQRDLAYLSRIWQVVVRRIRKLKAPAEIYQESDMITRTIRDTFTADIDSIVVDEPAAFEHAKEFLEIVMPRFADRIKLYDGKDPLFHRNGLEDEIARIQMRKIPLPHGGSIVIEQTEALVAIDVNSGNFRADNNAEETAFQMNLHAAKEIARQLRLRDLGGVIVNDFIDMRDDKHRRAVEKAMRDAVKRDRARTKVLKISAFGLIEMTRQRIRPSLKRSVYQDCPYCKGMAQVKTCESMSIEVMRMLQLAAHREHVYRIEVRVAEDVADYLLNRKRREISRLEESGEITVQVKGSPGRPPELLEFTCFDNNGNEVKVFASPEPPPTRHRR
jgi:ribonuclease E